MNGSAPERTLEPFATNDCEEPEADPGQVSADVSFLTRFSKLITRQKF